MQKVTKSIGLMSVVALVSACSGGGSDRNKPFSLATDDGAATVIQLNAAALTTSEATGDWEGSAQTVSIAGQTISAVEGADIADGLTFVRQLEGGSGGETLAFVPTRAANLPSGTASYEGAASVIVTDGANAAVSYNLTGSSLAVANIAEGNLDLTISELSGTRLASAAGPQAFTSTGAITITDLTLSAAGGIGADGETMTTITGVDAVGVDAGATTDFSGGIAGTSGQEIAGVGAVSDDDTILLTTFAGRQ